MKSKLFTTFLIVFLILFFCAGSGFAAVTLEAPADYQLEQNPGAGTLHYVDRTYTITSMPGGFVPDYLIRTMNDDRDEDIEIKFSLTEDSAIYVAYDSRSAGNIPCWMSCFESAGQIETTDVTLNLYKKFYAPGDVVLGKNYACGSDCSSICVPVPKGSNYIVFIEEGTTPAQDTDVISFVCPAIQGVDPAEPFINWSDDNNTRVLGVNSFSILGGMATVTGHLGSGDEPLSHRLTRGLGVSAGEPDEVDGDEKIEITFSEAYWVNSLELRSLFNELATPQNIREEAVVDFYLGDSITHTEPFIGSELSDAGGRGEVRISYTTPIFTDRLVFYVPEGLPESEFALARLVVEPATIAEIKESAIACLSNYVDESKRFGKAIKKIDKSLDPKYWVDDTHLECKHGNKVFDNERYAVKELMHLLKGVSAYAKCDGISRIELRYNGDGNDVEIEVFLKKDVLGTFAVSHGEIFVVAATEAIGGELHPAIKLVIGGEEVAEIHTSCSKPIEEGDIHGDFEIFYLEKLYKQDKDKKDQVSEGALACAEAAIEKLVKVDRILAETLLIEADGMVAEDPDRQDKADKEITKAYLELTKGDADRDAGKFDKAISHYKKAWKHACHAIKEATKVHS